MSLRNIHALLHPASVAVIGTAEGAHAPARTIIRNLLAGDFPGPILPVSPGTAAVAGVPAYASVADLPRDPDLALICTPVAGIAATVAALAERSVAAACIVTPRPLRDRDDAEWERIRRSAATAGMRLLGPGSMGLAVPAGNLNAGSAPDRALPGRIAFISQSGALCAATLDWATARGLGFSHFIHTGDGIDVDVPDLLDHLASDPSARAILLYLETIRDGRAFLSAARAAARNKPVLVVKAGRSRAGARAALFHSGALAGSDMVFDAVFRRAGMLRVGDIEEIFAAVETLDRTRPIAGRRIGVVTNGGGLGVIAADDIADAGGVLADLPAEQLAILDSILPPECRAGNPLDIGGDADSARYRACLDTLLAANALDSVLVIHAPSAFSDATEIARTTVETARTHPKTTIMACWIGDEKVGPARQLFAQASVPSFETPRAAVRGLFHLLDYRRNQDLLMEVPASVVEPARDRAKARAVIDRALAEGRTLLADPTAKEILSAYGIGVIESRFAATAAQAGAIAATMAPDSRCGVALKLVSPDILHKSDAGGVILALSGADQVAAAATAMAERIGHDHAGIRIEGFAVQPMAARPPGAPELIAGIVADPIFGPVILFGHGGVATETIDDRAAALPPLNMKLAADLIDGTRIGRRLAEQENTPAKREALCRLLVRLSQLAIDLPNVAELDINPLFYGGDAYLALDARIRLDPAGGIRPAIRPYPVELEERIRLADGRTALLRPIRPEDEPNHHEFISRLTPEDMRFRFFGSIRRLPHADMARLTQIDYDREMAFIAEIEGPDGTETVATIRTIADPDRRRAEFAIVVRSDLHAQGLGTRLMEKMVAYCRIRGIEIISAQVLRDNTRMLRFAARHGFRQVGGDDEIVGIERDLRTNGRAL